MTGLFDKITAFDPGLVNLKSALRGTLSVVISFFAVSILAGHLNQVPTLAFVSVIIAMMASITVGDAKLRQQKKTLLLLPFPAGAAFAFSVAMESFPIARVGGFLIITFAAVFLRRYGPRGAALGIVTFMAYFCPLFFPVHASAILGGVVAVFLAAAVTYFIRFFIIPDRPEKDLRLFLRAYQLLIQEVLKTLAMELKNFSQVSGEEQARQILRSRARIQKQLMRLNELGLTMESFLDSSDSAAVKSQSEALQLYLFERELALRQFLDFVSVWVSGGGIPSQEILAEASRIVQRLLETDTLPPQPPAGKLGDFFRALQALTKAPENQPVPEHLVQTVAHEMAAAEESPGRGKEKWHLSISTKQAIQATLATAAASAIGVSISPSRWYWASMTAFVIFAGATRGETLQRAFLRVLGTIAGLVFGFLLAFSLTGHHRLEWTVVIACVFMAIYGARMAFGFWSASIFTLMLAVLYDVLGQLTENILVLRLEETLAGSLVGALVAGLVLPTSTRATVREAMAKFLNSVAATLDELSRPVSSPFERRSLVRRLREVDRHLMGLRASAAPIVGRVSILRKGDLPATVFDAAVLAHFLRHLASYTGPRPKLTDEQVTLRSQGLAHQARNLVRQLEEGSAISVVEKVAIPEEGFLLDEDTPSRWFARLEQILGSLGKASLFQVKK